MPAPESKIGKKISQFDELTTLAGDEYFLVEDAAGVYKKILSTAGSITTAERAAIKNNSAKVTNQNHVGHIEGGLETWLQSAAITDQPLESPVPGDYMLIADASDSWNLKRVDVDFVLNSQTNAPVSRLKAQAAFWPQPGQH